VAGRPFGLEDAQRLRLVRDAGFVPGGRYGYYTVTEVVDRSRDWNTLWLFERDGADARRLAESDVHAPAPSPDGSVIAVTADVDGTAQLCLVPVEGGPARPLTRLPQGVSGGAVWSPDGRSVAFTAGPAVRRDRSLPYRVDRATYRYDGLGYLDDVVTDLYVADVATGEVRQLTADRCMNTEPRWSPDGTELSYLVMFPPDRTWVLLPELHVLTVATGETRTVVEDSWGGVFSAEWYGDRLVFAGTTVTDRLFATGKVDLWTVEAGGGKPECRTTDVTAGVGSHLVTDLPVHGELEARRIRVHEDAAYVGAQIGGDAVVYRVGLTGPESVERVAGGNGSAYLMDADGNGQLLTLVASFTEPPELVLGGARVTRLNDELLAGLSRPRLHALDVTAPDGVRTDAWVLTPDDGTDGPWPAVLSVHGGPYSAFGSTFVIDHELLAGAGIAVVFHNFRGSYGYGSAFSASITGNWGEAGSLDHHAALDAAIAAGLADPDRLGVCGISHGGFATCWLLGTSDRFTAGLAENPVTGWASTYGEMDSHWWVPTEFGGTPDELPEVYRERSPLTHAPACRTPLLFVVGDEDLRCPPSESERYYRVLRSNGVPTGMVRLPGSAHTGSWDGPVPARMAQNEALVEWFTWYLGEEHR
jgi:dipeptidyl aminopeptidase/acylaminoacyl peptidase